MRETQPHLRFQSTQKHHTQTQLDFYNNPLDSKTKDYFYHQNKFDDSKDANGNDINNDSKLSYGATPIGKLLQFLS